MKKEFQIVVLEDNIEGIVKPRIYAIRYRTIHDGFFAKRISEWKYISENTIQWSSRDMPSVYKYCLMRLDQAEELLRVLTRSSEPFIVKSITI